MHPTSDEQLHLDLSMHVVSSSTIVRVRTALAYKTRSIHLNERGDCHFANLTQSHQQATTMQLASPQLWESFLPQIDYSRRRYALGLFFILCQCIVWIAAAVITQFVYEENDDTSPFLMTCKSYI